MGDRFNDLKEKIKKISLVDPAMLEEILVTIVDEIEKAHREIRQGFTRPE